MKITTDEMNDIIRSWVDAELPLNPAGHETNDQTDDIHEARERRFEELVGMPDDEFRAIYREKTGRNIRPMQRDGSYIEN